MTPLTAVAISGSPSRGSKSRQLIAHALVRLAAEGTATRAVELLDLPADALLGRERSALLDGALAAIESAQVVVIGTPVYRASYSGLLKVFFDLFEPDALAGKTALLIATGGAPGHQLVIDHALRPLLASVGATAVPTGVYGTDAQFEGQTPAAPLLGRLDRAVNEALALAAAARPAIATVR